MAPACGTFLLRGKHWKLEEGSVNWKKGSYAKYELARMRQKESEMKKYYVICKETCPECHGGYIVDPIYEDLAKEREKWFKENLTPDQMTAKEDAWMDEQGYPPNKWPQEEWECDNCEGTGIQESEVELSKVLTENCT